MTGDFYPRLRAKRGDTDDLAACIDRVVLQLEQISTSGDKPGMLLGKIQSGKTRAFVGSIARAFDRGFDIALVLTKGTKTLSAQTVSRLGADFSEFIDEDELLVLDIMRLPGKLISSELRRKIVVVAKKQAKNLERLIDFMQAHQALQNRRVLLIDDEADLASIRFVAGKGGGPVEQGTIADQMDTLRRMVDQIAFLQVTATPYSLYLQPEDYDAAAAGNYVFKPKRPAFTEVLPIHSGYVGGDDYFLPHPDDDPRSKLFVEVDLQEQDALRRADQRRISRDRVLDSPNTKGLRRAILTFLVAVQIRRSQQREAGERQQKYAMVIHNDTKRSAHNWQYQVVDWIFEALATEAAARSDKLGAMFDIVFSDLASSVSADHGRVPDRDEILRALSETLQSDEVVREAVNSDSDVMALLDDKAELKLRTPFNIFVGGNILDRGITIPQLISFYYGRNPGTMQADTVLQHSRMYGNRDRRDLAVTRFYTSQTVYSRLYTINEFENALRSAFDNGTHDNGVVFLQADATGGIRPCAPNKVLLSDVVSLQPDGLLLPTDFVVKSPKKIEKAQNRINQLIDPLWITSGAFELVDKSRAMAIIGACEECFEFPNDEFEWEAMRSLIDYYLESSRNANGQLLLIAENNRNLDRLRSGDKSGRSILGTSLRARVQGGRDLPALVMLQQTGRLDLNWSGAPFWWPILAAPSTAEPVVFAGKTAT